MDTQKLRQRILDLAIRGKLVPQDPNDEPASVLLKRIRAEKERLIAEGKIKRPKAKKSTDKSHYQQFTPPFDIPGSWKWVRMEDICFAITDGDHQAPPKANDGIPFLVISDIITGIIKFDKCRYVPYEYYSNLETNRKPSKGDILFTVTGSYGKSVIVETDKPFCFQRHIGLIKPILISKYLNIVLCSEYLEKECDAKATGTAQKTVGLESLRNFFIPIPPLEEQNRIIKLINSFEDLLQILESERSNLDVDIKLAKSKILDLAMQGKLVPQDPADEPAAEMLRHINPKAKIITDNPQCRNLPLGWTFCQLRDLCSFLSRGKSPKYSETPNQYPVFAQKCNLKDGDISLSQARFLDETTISKWPEKYCLRDGDVLVNSTGTGTVGRTRIFRSEYLGDYPFVVPDSHVSVVRSFDEIESTFIFYSLYCQEGQQYFDENLAGSTNQKELYIDVIGTRNIMLPPINEQKRIVAKIEELYSVLDKIEASLRS